MTPLTLRHRAKRRFGHVTTGLYMVTAICGLVDAVCFVGLGGVVAEMMTGNLLLMALAAGSLGLMGDATRYLPPIFAFILGALLGGRLLRGPKKLQERRIGFAVEWVILIAATAVTWRYAPTANTLEGHVVVAMLALAMGLQNAMVRVHGVPDLATNVMTATFTGIIADSGFAGGDNRNWRRRVLSVGLFMSSAAFGAVLLPFGIIWPLVAACIVFSVAMVPLLFGGTHDL
jgi:uncharacterized membrane protein YoaK (UPF0700 family)